MTKENEYFKIETADDCVWITDKRGENKAIHLTKKQSEELGGMLKPELSVEELTEEVSFEFRRCKGFKYSSSKEKIMFKAVAQAILDKLNQR